jgi:hypothetical protein
MPAEIGFRPIVASAPYFLDVLEQQLQAGWPRKLFLSDASVAPSQTGDPPPKIRDVPRLIIMLSGRQTYASSRQGERIQREFEEGDAVFWGRHAWTLEYWEEPCVFFGVVYHSEFVRLLKRFSEVTHQLCSPRS